MASKLNQTQSTSGSSSLAIRSNPLIIPMRAEPTPMKDEEKFSESAYPLSVTCPSCNRAIITKLEPVTGRITYLSCVGCLLACCWLGCFLIPFNRPECQDVKHICPECGHYFGRLQRC